MIAASDRSGLEFRCASINLDVRRGFEPHVSQPYHNRLAHLRRVKRRSFVWRWRLGGLDIFRLDDERKIVEHWRRAPANSRRNTLCSCCMTPTPEGGHDRF